MAAIKITDMKAEQLESMRFISYLTHIISRHFGGKKTFATLLL